MAEIHRQLDDEAFIRQFEGLELPEGSITHEAHFRIAWLYMDRYPLSEATDRIIQGILKFDKAYAGGTKYHATITYAYIHIMADRMKKDKAHNWQEFLRTNPDLLHPVDQILCQYYSPDRLFSDEAKKSFIAPDVEPIPGFKF